VSDVPKPLATVCGRPFAEYLIAQLAASGVARVTLLAGYMAEQLEAELGELSHGVELAYSVEANPLGTGGAMRNALEFLTGDRWLVLNGDSLFDIDLFELTAAHTPGTPATLALASVRDAGRYGCVSVDSGGSVTGFVEKSAESPADGWINAGVYVIERSAVEVIASDRPVSLEREVLPALIGRGLRARQFEGYFIDIGVPDDYLRAQQECSVFERLISAAPR
jgi:D-glycero-alpha-D-manno-heptose 1-phosphate guanylyltransferase